MAENKGRNPAPPSPPPAGEKPGRTVPCPQCRGPAAWEGNPHRPFCSERCRLIDLGAWAEEKYRLPGEEVPGPDEGNEG